MYDRHSKSLAKADLESCLGLRFKCGTSSKAFLALVINPGRFGLNLFFGFIQRLLCLSTSPGVGNRYSLEEISPSGAYVYGDTQENQGSSAA